MHWLLGLQWLRIKLKGLEFALFRLKYGGSSFFSHVASLFDDVHAILVVFVSETLGNVAIISSSVCATFMVDLVEMQVRLVFLKAVFKELGFVLCLSAPGLLEEHLDSQALFFLLLLLVFGSLVFV